MSPAADDRKRKLGQGERTLVLGKPKAWQIAEVVRESTLPAWVTKGEDAELRKKGLHKSMPKGWDGKDKFARYNDCGIHCESIEASP